MSEGLSKVNSKTEFKEDEAVQRKQKQVKKALPGQKKANGERKTKEVKSESRRHGREQLEGAPKKIVEMKKQAADRRADREVEGLRDWADAQGENQMELGLCVGQWGSKHDWRLSARATQPVCSRCKQLRPLIAEEAAAADTAGQPEAAAGILFPAPCCTQIGLQLFCMHLVLITYCAHCCVSAK